MRYLEHELQSECLRWFSYQYSLYKDIIFAIPNARKSSKKQGGRLKKEGVKSGIPDVFLPVPKKGFHGLFIEFKSEHGVVSDNQEIKINRLTELGYKVEVVNCFDKFERVINEYLR